MLCSVFTHCVALTFVVLLGPRLFFYDRDTVDLSRFHVEPLRLTLDEPFFLPPPPKGERPAPKPQKAPPQPARDTAAKAQPSPDSAPPALSASARVELPAPRRKPVNAPIIMQPDYDPRALPPVTAVPPMAFWARQAPDLPKPPAPRTEIKPGRTEAPSPPARPRALPVMAVPNRETAIADVNIAMPPVELPKPPALPVPNSATVPVNAPNVTQAQTASFESFAGQPVNVLAIGRKLEDVKKVEVPRGYQNVPEQVDHAQAGAGAERPNPNAQAPKSSSTSPSAATARPPAAPGSGVAGQRPATTASNTPGRTTPASDRPKPASNSDGGAKAVADAAAKAAADAAAKAAADAAAKVAADAARAAADAARTAAEAASRAAAADAAARAAADAAARIAAQARAGDAPKPEPPSPPRPSPDVTRINHPIGGNFDVVIMQSATRDELPDLGVILSGNPIYTVYLKVGDRKEWLLEYCIPVKESAQNNSYQITVEDPGVITPPYPIATAVPNSLLGQQITKNIVLHGLLTAAGDLRVSKSSETGNPFVAQLLALLGEWRFRPALRNKKAIDVEVLLVIPPRG